MDIICLLYNTELMFGCVIRILANYLWLRSRRVSLRLPPSPLCLPFLGPIGGSMIYSKIYWLLKPWSILTAINFIFVGDPERPRLWLRWARKLKSDVVSIHFFPLPFPIVTLNSYESIREAFVGQDSADALAGRPHFNIWKNINPNYLGVANEHYVIIILIWYYRNKRY